MEQIIQTRRNLENAQAYTDARVKVDLDGDKVLCCEGNGGCTLERANVLFVEANENSNPRSWTDGVL
jgi:hypothetical protein